MIEHKKKKKVLFECLNEDGDDDDWCQSHLSLSEVLMKSNVYLRAKSLLKIEKSENCHQEENCEHFSETE